MAALRAFRARYAAFLAPHAVCGRTTPAIAINFFRAIHRFDNAKSVTTCAVFFSNPRKRTFAKPNWRLMTRNGCSTFARTLALPCSFFLSRSFARPSGSLAMSLGLAAMCY